MLLLFLYSLSLPHELSNIFLIGVIAGSFITAFFAIIIHIQGKFYEQ